MGKMVKIVPQKVKNCYHLMVSYLADFMNGGWGKRLRIVGVTGTDGKTTVTNVVKDVLDSVDSKAGMLSTVGGEIGRKSLGIGYHTTTPSSFFIQSFLKKVGEKGGKNAVVEVTSHGLDQHRLEGVNFEVGVLTNVSWEHLDYHKKIENYIKTKVKLLKKSKYRVVNCDFCYFNKVKKEIGRKNIFCYGEGREADFRILDMRTDLKGSSFSISYKGRKTRLKSRVLGDFNIFNLTAGYCVGIILGVDEDELKKVVEEFRLPAGRLEVVIENPFLVIVDYGHTAGAFESILPFLKKQKSGRLIHVFGATGERDRDKREVMGNISGKYADMSILTSDDCYFEDGGKIMEEIEVGVKMAKGEYIKIEDRRQAIKKAVELAKKGDVVLLTGIGHQKTINIKGEEIPWDEVKIAKEYVSKKK